MKRPSRMRKTDYPIDMDSSAFEVHSISSDSIGTSYRTRQSNNYLVSARYNRRRTVKFKIPESDKVILKEIKEAQFKNGLSGTDVLNNEDDAGKRKGNTTDSEMRMNATELPPIVKSSTHLNNGFITQKNNTFNKFNFHSKPDRKSVHSDSSLQGYIVTSHSRTSSSSSQKSRGRVLSAGTDKRTNRQLITADITKSITRPANLKQDSPIMRNGGNTVLAQRTVSVGGLCRQKTKYSLKDSISTQRTLTQSRSDAQLTLPTRNNNDSNSMRRNESDRSLTDLKNNNVKYQHKPGLRRYASTNGLYVKDDKRNDDDGLEKEGNGDSDTDSDKDQRVLNWIIGVNEVAEPPEEPKIEHVDEPPQRDTAIRIVYGGDS